MNILLDALPENVNGIPVRSGFRTMIQLELMMDDPEVPREARLPLALNLLYKQPADDLQKAVDGLLWFYSCGSPDAPERIAGGKTTERAYDFETDAPDIYAAFLQTYGINLNTAELHWWAFRALLGALPESCKIVRIMGYRTRDLSDLKGKEKKYYAEMKARYKLRPLGLTRLTAAAAQEAAKARMNRRFAEAERWAKAHAVPY